MSPATRRVRLEKELAAAYILKCTQERIRHHGDQFYEEFKRIRNFIE